MFCKNCGARLKAGSKFCTSCGEFKIVNSRNAKGKLQTSTSRNGVPYSFFSNRNSKRLSDKNRTKIIIVAATAVIGILLLIINSNSSHSVIKTKKNIDNAEAVVGVYCDNDKGGSGVIFTSDGTIITNNHVVTGATSCQATIPNPTTGGIYEIYNAKPVITPTLSKKYDVAILKIDRSYTDSNGKTWGNYPTKFTPFVLPSSCNTSTISQLGDSVRIYGYPVTSGGYNLTITDGIISSFTEGSYILTSAKVDSGNSGGLAVDENGCWLGIPSAVISGNYQNLGVIIPGSVVKRFLSSVPAKDEPVVSAAGANALISSIPTTPQETNNQACQAQFGTYSEYAGYTSSDGSLECICQSGYSWDGTGKTCATQLSLKQSCQSSYGVGSYAYEQSGKAVCGCSIGYQWNSGDTSCVPVQESNYQICQDNYGPNSTWSGQTNSQGNPMCECRYGYTWNADQTACVSQPSCPTFSSYNSTTGACECLSGYKAINGACESNYTYCQNLYGYGATYDYTSDSCACSYDYVYSNGQCVSGDTYCQDADGYGATYDATTNSCTCSSGYVADNGQCVNGSTYCFNHYGLGSEFNYATNGCECQPGYISNGSSCVYNSSY